MSNYAQITTFAAKDALASGNPAKLGKGADVDAEFGAISTAIATKLDLYSTATALTALSGADMLSAYDNANAIYKRITVANARLALTPFADTAFFAVGSGTQNVATNTLTRMNLQTKFLDTGTNFTAGTPGFYTAPVTGTYIFFLASDLTFTNTITSTLQILLEIATGGGVFISNTIVCQAISNILAQPMAMGFYVTGMTAGQRVYLDIQHNNGSTMVSDGNLSFFGGWRLA